MTKRLSPDLSHLVRNPRAHHPDSYGANADRPTFSPLRRERYVTSHTGFTCKAPTVGAAAILKWAERFERRSKKGDAND